jgi:hypothetical protein
VCPHATLRLPRPARGREPAAGKPRGSEPLMPPRQAYVILRRRAELFINLMMLMKDANIPYRPCLAHRRPKPVPRAARVPQSAAHATLGADTAELPHFTKPDLTRFAGTSAESLGDLKTLNASCTSERPSCPLPLPRCVVGGNSVLTAQRGRHQILGALPPRDVQRRGVRPHAGADSAESECTGTPGDAPSHRALREVRARSERASAGKDAAAGESSSVCSRLGVGSALPRFSLVCHLALLHVASRPSAQVVEWAHKLKQDYWTT